MTQTSASSSATMTIPEDDLKGIDRLRQKLRPALLYVVSTAQFFDIGMYLSILHLCDYEAFIYAIVQ
jgi:hypothetical protein